MYICYRQFVKSRQIVKFVRVLRDIFFIAPLLLDRTTWKFKYHYFSLIFPSYPNFSPIDEIELCTKAEERWKMEFSPLSSFLPAIAPLVTNELIWNLNMMGTSEPNSGIWILESFGWTEVKLESKRVVRLNRSRIRVETSLKVVKIPFSSVLQLLYEILSYQLNWTLDMMGI